MEAMGSPLRFFALAVLVCNTVFGYVAAKLDDPEAFKFSIHMFLGIVGAFILIALWAPRALYHPQELEGVEDLLPKTENPLLVTLVLGVALVSYVAYQVLK